MDRVQWKVAFNFYVFEWGVENNSGLHANPILCLFQDYSVIT